MPQTRPTLNDYATLINDTFEAMIADATTIKYIFNNRLKAWESMPFILGDVSNDIARSFIQGVIAPYLEPIDRENELIKSFSNTQLNGAMTNRIKRDTDYGRTVTTTRAGQTTTTFTDGGEKIKDFVYPAGYTMVSDPAYLASEQTRESPADNITTETPNTTDTAKDSGIDTETVTDFDLSAWVAALTADGKDFNIIKYIDKIIFSLIDPIL